MNKLLKCAFGVITLITLSIVSFSNAGLELRNSETVYFEDTLETYTKPIGIDIMCFVPVISNSCNGIWFNFLDITSAYRLVIDSAVENIGGIGYCTEGNVIRFVSYDQNECGITINSYNYDNYTSLQCQTEYNLIPISEVTPNYCALNFGMIDPQQCPINEGTGTIVRSNLMINDIPYAQNQNINVFIPDFLAWNIAFNDFNTVIEVEGYNADEEYIENVINNEKLTPTNEDIENMITGFMINYFPYLALIILFLYLARKIYQIFK